MFKTFNLVDLRLHHSDYTDAAEDAHTPTPLLHWSAVMIHVLSPASHTHVINFCIQIIKLNDKLLRILQCTDNTTSNLDLYLRCNILPIDQLHAL
jgi:hypothetical protein